MGNRADQPRNNNNNGRQAQPPQAQPRVNQTLIDEDMPPPIEGADIVTIAGGPHLAGTSHNSHEELKMRC